MSTHKKVVIYTRYSSDMQSPRSCEDQEREVRQALTRKGIDHSAAVVINDRAESGTRENREGYQQIIAMRDAGLISILAVDDQSRLSRGDHTVGFIRDLIYRGGRFFSLGEGTDTAESGWELKAKVTEFKSSADIADLSRRVRRGQAGRVLANRSAGDYCYGFQSLIIGGDTEASHRERRPERKVVVDEEQAKWVLQIFVWFAARRSLSWIAQELTRLAAPTSRRRKSSKWKPYHVRKILSNEKYIGVWRWGTTQTLRDSESHKKQVPTPVEDHVVVHRPELRIIDDELWQKVQQLLSSLKDVYGIKQGQGRRGPKHHHTLLYPDGLLPGLVFCAKCGSRLWQENGAKGVYLGCPNRGTGAAACSMCTRVPLARAEAAVVECVSSLLKSSPAWVNEAVAQMRAALKRDAGTAPKELARDEKQLAAMENKLEKLVDLLADGNCDSQAVLGRVKAMEREADDLRAKIAEARRFALAPADLPADEWIAQELEQLATAIQGGGHEVMLMLRKLIGPIKADGAIAPGKKRGLPRLSFSLSGFAAIDVLSEGKPWQYAVRRLQGLESTDNSLQHEVALEIGSPSAMETWGPKIYEMRKRGVKWKEIWKITGLGSGPAYEAWKRYRDWKESA